MQALILAAGVGSRLGAMTQAMPKCMIEVNGRRLIDLMLDILVDLPIERVVIVDGYRADVLRSHLGDAYKGCPIEYVSNPDYRRTNNSYSVLVAADALRSDDTLFLESDLVFSPRLLADCLADPSPDLAVVARLESWMNGTVTTLNADGYVSSLVMKGELNPAEADRYFKTVNIYKLSRDLSRDAFLPALAAHLGEHGPNDYYEIALKRVVAEGRARMKALIAPERSWYEIDDQRDLAAAATMFAQSVRKRAHSV